MDRTAQTQPCSRSLALAVYAVKKRKPDHPVASSGIGSIVTLSTHRNQNESVPNYPEPLLHAHGNEYSHVLPRQETKNVNPCAH